jgi:hypothetical protein
VKWVLEQEWGVVTQEILLQVQIQEQIVQKQEEFQQILVEENMSVDLQVHLAQQDGLNILAGVQQLHVLLVVVVVFVTALAPQVLMCF